MGLLRRLFGGGDQDKPDPAEAKPGEAPPAAGSPGCGPVDPSDPSARLDAARSRLREQIPPIEDDGP